jgi:Family of unknown function (DUF6196)
MYISDETSEQMRARLLRVIAEAEFEVFARPYAFVETSAAAFPSAWVETALAFVRDDQVWSALVPSEDPQFERFRVFGFHFTPGLENSGFVGWLAAHLKATLGTGVMEICGQNASRGGIFDYWGVPLAVGEAAVAEIDRLRRA